jgi:hypothetical protein
MVVRILMFAIFVVAYILDFLLHPAWSNRIVIEIGLIVVGILLIAAMYKASKEINPDSDESTNISPADRVRKIHEKSKNRSGDETK